MKEERSLTLRVLVLDDQLAEVSTRLRSALRDFAEARSTFPNLSLLTEEETPLILTGLCSLPVRMTMVCNRGRETDAATVRRRIENGDFKGTFDLVLLDDRWDDGDTAGRDILLSAVDRNIKGISPELPIISLFTRYLDKTRLKTFYEVLPEKVKTWERVLPRDKNDEIQLIDLMQRTIATKRMAAILALEKEQRVKAEKYLEIEREQRRRFGVPKGAIPENPPTTKRPIIGKSDVMRVVYYFIERYSKFPNVPVHLYGETGVGKDLVAAAMHELSSRNKHRLVTVNCAALAAADTAIVNGDIFGRVKGALGVKDGGQTGHVERANHGTLFLNEVHLLPKQTQGLLLRFLETGNYELVGGSKEEDADIRVISASEKRLTQLADEDVFIPSLIARLNAESPIEIPPLRERGSDIVLLFHFFLNKYCTEYNLDVPKASEEIISSIVSNPWQRNVRGLEQFVRNLLIRGFGEGASIDQGCLDLLSENSQSYIAANANRQLLVKPIDLDKADMITVDRYVTLMFEYIKMYGVTPSKLEDVEQFIASKSGKTNKKRPRSLGPYLVANSADWVRIVRDNKDYLAPIIPILALSEPIRKGLVSSGLLS